MIGKAGITVPDLKHLLSDPQNSKLLGNEKKLEQLRSAPETQQLFSLLSQSAGGDLEQSVQAGDSASIISAIQKVMHTAEGAKLIQSMRDKLQ